MAWADLMSEVGAELLRASPWPSACRRTTSTSPSAAPRPGWASWCTTSAAWWKAGDQGVGSHADYGFVTLLLQDEVGGLEVKPHGQDEWVDRGRRSRARWWSTSARCWRSPPNGYLLATIHRVNAPPPGVDRYSVPFFWSPRLDAVIDPVPLPDDLPAEARGLSDDPTNPMLASFGLNMLKGWMRAHPDVTERHYPELMQR